MTFIESLQRDWPVTTWADTTVVVAVSGGADSVALLLGLHSTRTAASGKGQLIVAHFNHGLRGPESDADESFVVELAARLKWRCEFQRMPQASEEPTGSVTRRSEDASRRARYEFLKEVARRTGARFVATAHTADDQVETILHRILRGTGIEGLAGIPRVREFIPGVTLIRPLLAIRRQEVLEFLRATGESFREDSSNRARDYTRNRLRLELLPQLEREFNPQVRQALWKLGALAGEVNQLIQTRVDALLAVMPQAASRDAHVVECEFLIGVESYVIRQLLMAIWEKQNWPMRDMPFESWNALAGMIETPHRFPPKIVFPGEVVAERAGNQLKLQRRA